MTDAFEQKLRTLVDEDRRRAEGRVPFVVGFLCSSTAANLLIKSRTDCEGFNWASSSRSEFRE